MSPGTPRDERPEGGDAAADAGEEEGRTVVTLSLVSHTNVGKTTLARTLLRRDVGEVLDQAHVTEVSEAHELITAGDAELRLWDTPGFGDSVRLLERLRREKSPVLWFLSQTWDRFTDRPLWSSQQAAITVRDDTDVVLYLVNATELPEEAGYVAPELELLSWIGRPVLLLLNQTGELSLPRAVVAERRDAWRRHVVDRWEVVEDVLALDAFSRSWVQEGLLFDRIVPLLPVAKRPAMERLAAAWHARNRRVFEHSIDALADYLATVAADREPLPSRRPSKSETRRAMEALGERVEEATGALMAALLARHGLEGTAAAVLERQMDAFSVEGIETINPERGALLGSVVSGALGGLAADVLAGGLTFGGGMVAGAILGALGGAGLARGYQLVTAHKRAMVGWSPPFLDQLLAQTLLRYLAVAHFGRGRGAFELQAEEPRRWRDAVAAALGRDVEARAELWKDLARGDTAVADARRRLRPHVARALEDILKAEYPGAKIGRDG